MLHNKTGSDVPRWKIRTRTDKIARRTAVVICGLLAEAVVTAGTLIFVENMFCQADARTQNMMDGWSRNCFGNTLDAINSAKVIGATFIMIDLAPLALWLGRRLCRHKSPTVRGEQMANVQDDLNVNPTAQSTLIIPGAA